MNGKWFAQKKSSLAEDYLSKEFEMNPNGFAWTIKLEKVAETNNFILYQTQNIIDKSQNLIK